MKKTRKKIIIFTVLGVFILALFAFFLTSPVGRALLKSKSHFIAHVADSRVLYEQGAEEFAEKIADFLPTAIKRVEEGHFLPFKKPFKVYVFSTQKSHNESLANTTSYPIRGAATPRNVFIAPSAFSFKGLDTHKESLMHELSHLHLNQRLGFLKRRKIPSWFTEGLANIIAGSGGEGISDEMAIQYIKEGRHLVIPESGGFLKNLTKTIQEAGLTGPMYHKQNKMFVDYINGTDPEAFKKLVLAVQKAEAFSPSFLEYFETSPEEMWSLFKSELLSTANEGNSR
ncbi:MAG: hypothetical protein GTO16_03210 [Candidatus Aminicenantes bacterium]|nr:hypothetical protein [Candidatus Aminicenantes bacterium]